MSKKKILIIDDDNAIADALHFMLTSEGFEVIKVSDVQQVDLSKKKLPDLFLLDVILPGGDGKKFCRSIKDNMTTAHIPVILLSASIEVGKTGSKFGADYFLPKPFSTKELLGVVSKFI